MDIVWNRKNECCHDDIAPDTRCVVEHLANQWLLGWRWYSAWHRFDPLFSARRITVIWIRITSDDDGRKEDKK